VGGTRRGNSTPGETTTCRHLTARGCPRPPCPFTLRADRGARPAPHSTQANLPPARCDSPTRSRTCRHVQSLCRTGVECPRFLPFSPWQYVFPSVNLSVDPRSGIRRRHHAHESPIARAVKRPLKRVRTENVNQPRLRLPRRGECIRVLFDLSAGLNDWPSRINIVRRWRRPCVRHARRSRQIPRLGEHRSSIRT
jgi:hypothetical protein